jgi:MFS family permease
VFLSFTITTGPIITFIPLLAAEHQLGNPGLFFTVNSFATIFAMLMSGPIADRVGRSAVIVPGLLSTASAMFLLTFASNQAMFLGAGVLAGAGFGLIQPGIQSMTVDRVAPRERSSALATLQSGWDVGGSGGAFMVGPIAGALTVASTFGIAGIASILGLGGFIAANARRPSGQEAAPPDEGRR